MQNQPPQNTPWDVILRRVRNAPPTSSPPPHTPLPFTNPNWLNTPLSIRLTVRRWVIIALVILIVLIGSILLGRLSLSVSGNQSQVTQPNNSNPPNSQQNIVPQVPTDTPTPTPTPPPQPGTIL